MVKPYVVNFHFMKPQGVSWAHSMNMVSTCHVTARNRVDAVTQARQMFKDHHGMFPPKPHAITFS